MGTLLFREEQPVGQTIIPLFLIMIWLFVTGMFGWGFYEQLVLSQPWGDNPTSDTTLIITGITVIVGLGVMVMLLIRNSLITEVHTDGFYYRFPPFVNKMRRIPVEQIATVEVRKYGVFPGRIGAGVKRSPLRRTTAYQVGGNKVVLITLKTGRRIVFGTKKMEEMRRAVDRMMTGRDNHRTTF